MNIQGILIKNVIPAGSGIDDPDAKPLSPNAARMKKQIIDTLNQRAIEGNLQNTLRKHAFRKGTIVEVLDIRDNTETQDNYITPNLPGIVADIRGPNWDGEITESCIDIADLDIGLRFIQDEKTSPEDILEAFKKYQSQHTREC